MLDGFISTLQNSFLWKGILSIVSFQDLLVGANSMAYYVVDFFFGWIYLPQMPSSVLVSMNRFLDLVFENISILGFFIRIPTLKLFLTLTLAVWGFKYVYRIVLWILKKIPFVGIE